nr:ribulose-1,5 bisphosphate carboxylase/oxygenase large subunit n-methyltransferase, chloroplastic [Quercus suber]
MEDWLKQSGASGLDNLELTDFSDTGRGVRTLRRCEEGDKILTIPHVVLWTVKHASADPILGPVLRSIRPPLSIDDTLATSGYDGLRNHVVALPASYTSSIFFTEAELELCAGTSLYTTTKHLNQQIEGDYQQLVARLFGRHRGLFPADSFTIDDYKWALCTVWSRAMDFKLHNGDSIRLLAPFADMLNHSSDIGQCHIYDPLSGNLSVTAGKAYEPGDQVFINYGPVANGRLSRLYGFVVPDNPNDGYDLVLATHPTAPFFQQKHKLWTAAGLDSTSTVTLTLTEPLPSSVLQYLRIQRLNESDLAELVHHQSNAASEKISMSNEVEILEFLVESISTLLDGFVLQLEKLDEQLAEGLYTPGGKAWLAAHVSLGEQRVLRLTRKTAKALLVAADSTSRNEDERDLLSTPAQCAKCKKGLTQVMWCGRCNAVTYCGRACQVAHYKEHKADCQATAAETDSRKALLTFCVEARHARRPGSRSDWLDRSSDPTESYSYESDMRWWCHSSMAAFAYEHSLLPSSAHPISPSSKLFDILDPKVSLPLDITIETIFSVLLLCIGVVLSSPALKPIRWNVWAGRLEKSKQARQYTEVGVGGGNPYANLEERPGFLDIRARRKEFATWVKDTQVKK